MKIESISCQVRTARKQHQCEFAFALFIRVRSMGMRS